MQANKKVSLIFVLTILFGGIIGYKFGQNEHFKFYKLLNLFGLIYDFIAVVLLSYVVIAKGIVQDRFAHYLSLVFIIFTTTFPGSFHIGISIGGGKAVLEGSIYAFIFLSITPALYIYCSPVLEPLSFKSYSPTSRVKILGTLLLLIGFAFQIVAGIVDIGS